MASDIKIGKLKISPFIVLALIIAFGIVRLILIFSTRDGHHVDEVWSYGFANSYYQANVYGWDDDINRINVDEWIKGNVFKDYITVSEEEADSLRKNGCLRTLFLCLCSHACIVLWNRGMNRKRGKQR